MSPDIASKSNVTQTRRRATGFPFEKILSRAGYDTEMKTSQLTVLTSVLALLSLAALAQEYPVKPIRVITPYGAGGASDIVVRAGVHEMSKQMGQSFIVENRTRAGAT